MKLVNIEDLQQNLVEEFSNFSIFFSNRVKKSNSPPPINRKKELFYREGGGLPANVYFRANTESVRF